MNILTLNLDDLTIDELEELSRVFIKMGLVEKATEIDIYLWWRFKEWKGEFDTFFIGI